MSNMWSTVTRYTSNFSRTLRIFLSLFDWWLFRFTTSKCKYNFSSTPFISHCINYAIKPPENRVWLELYRPSNEQFCNALIFIHVIPFLAVFNVIRCSHNDYTYGPTQTIWSFRARMQGHADSHRHNANEL